MPNAYIILYLREKNVFHVFSLKKQLNRFKNILQFDIYPKPGEAEALYYKRIIAQYGYEKENEYRKRMEIYKFLLPGLPIWNNDAYLKYKSFDFTASEPEITEEARVS